MKTLPAKFLQFKDRTDVTRTFVLKVTDGSTTWYFSDHAINLTDGECYPLLQTSFSTAEGINIGARTWTSPKCELRITNTQNIKNADGTFGRPSDYLIGLRYQDATLYLAVGSDTGTIADMATIFDGVVSSSPIYDANRVSLRLSDRAIHWDKLLPETLLTPPRVFANEEYIPVVYGEFSYDTVDQDYNASLGLAKAIPTNGQRTAFIVSDHALDAFTELHAIDKRLDDPVAYVTRTLSADSGGQGKATSVSIKVDAVLWPTIELRFGVSEGYDDEPADGIGETNIVDRDTTTSATLYNNLIVGSDPLTDPEGIVIMSFGEGSFLNEQKGTFKLSQWTTDVGTYTLFEKKVRLYFYTSPDEYIEENLTFSGAWVDSASFIDKPIWRRSIETAVFTGSGLDDASEGGTFTGVETHTYTVTITATGTPDAFQWQKDDNAPTTGVGITGSAQTLSEGVTVTFTATTGHTVDDKWVITARAELYNQPYAIAIYVRGRATDANGDMDFVNVFGMRLKFRYAMASADVDGWWAACDGLAFGSWATTRSTNYSDGDPIKDPVQIIHSIFRDILGEGDSRIDHASFAAAENTSVEARINLYAGNRLSVYAIMAQLANQSTAAVYISAAGLVRAVALNDKSPSIDRTFKWTDIRANSLNVSMTGGVVNYLNYHSRYQQEYKAFRDATLIEDSTSQSTYNGTYQKTAKWPNIAGASATHVAEWLVNTTDGIISKDHVKIRFSSEGFKDYDLDVGDYIRLDEATVSPSISYPGGTWTSQDFLITNMVYKNNQIDFTAVELY